MKTTKIMDRDVPIQPGPTTKLSFSGAAEAYDNAVFEFWTIVAGNVRLDVARQHAGKDPGERWRREESNQANRAFNDRAKTATLLRPANKEEVELWLNSHMKDAKFAAESCEVAGTAMKLSGPPYRLQSKGPGSN